MEEEKRNEVLEDEDELDETDLIDEDGDKKVEEETEKEERARQARLRREREARERKAREEEIRRNAKLEGELEASTVNTYTNEPIKDEYDLKIFKLQRELEKEGKDPISDLPRKLAEMERSANHEARLKEQKKKEDEEIIEKDIKDFQSKYPDVSLAELLKDPDFKDYSDGRLGVKGGLSLAKIYENFNKFKDKYSKTTKEEEGSDKAIPPSPNGGRKTKQTSYAEMSEEEKIKELRRQGLIK